MSWYIDVTRLRVRQSPVVAADGLTAGDWLVTLSDGGGERGLARATLGVDAA